MLASLGGTTVFLFGLTKSAAGQPRAIIGGHLGGAAIGIACGQFLGESAYSCVLAVALTLSWMLVTRTVHPPAGANPLIMIHAHANWIALLSPVIISIVVLMTVAMIWSRLIPGTIHYPHSIFEPSPPDSGWGPWKREFSEEVTDET